MEYDYIMGEKKDLMEFLKTTDKKPEPEEKEEDESPTLGSSFAKKLNIQDFIFDILNYVYNEGTNWITEYDMQEKILDHRNKNVKSLIAWLHDKGDDPDKSYGLSWDPRKRLFYIDDGEE